MFALERSRGGGSERSCRFHRTTTKKKKKKKKRPKEEEHVNDQHATRRTELAGESESPINVLLFNVSVCTCIFKRSAPRTSGQRIIHRGKERERESLKKLMMDFCFVTRSLGYIVTPPALLYTPPRSWQLGTGRICNFPSMVGKIGALRDPRVRGSRRGI